MHSSIKDQDRKSTLKKTKTRLRSEHTFPIFGFFCFSPLLRQTITSISIKWSGLEEEERNQPKIVNVRLAHTKREMSHVLKDWLTSLKERPLLSGKTLEPSFACVLCLESSLD